MEPLHPALQRPAPTPITDLASGASKPAKLKVEPVKKQPKKKLLYIVGAFACLGIIFFVALLLLGRSSKNPEQSPTMPMPAAELNPKPETPEDYAQEQKQAAIQLVKSWPAPNGLKTIGEILDAQAPQTGQQAGSWTCEKVMEDVYRVTFNSPKSPEGQAQAYDFEAHLGNKIVLTQNPAAQALLAGPPADKPAAAEPAADAQAAASTPPATPKHRKKSKRIKIRAKRQKKVIEGPVSDEPPESKPPEEAPAPASQTPASSD